MQTVDVGETVPLTSYWWDENLDGAEPSSIDLTITAPDGTETTAAKGDMTGSASTGVTLDTWVYAITVDQEGVWRWTFEGVVDGATITQDGMFLVGAASRAPGPCEPWCTWEDVLNTCPNEPDLADLDTGVREQILDRATWLLYALDGGRYPGICTATRRICRSCSVCRTSCCCTARDSLDLRGRFPVYDVWDVTIDGEVLARSAYQVRNRRWLDRIDGDRWPNCTDLSDPDAFTISWAYGRNPPIGLMHAAAVFAAELAKGCVGSEDCKIPDRVVTVNREGVSYVILDSQKFLDQGRTGIYEVDIALIAASDATSGSDASRVSPGGGSPLQRRQSYQVG